MPTFLKAAAAVVVLALSSPYGRAASLEVDVSNVKATNGVLRISLFQTLQDYRLRRPFQEQSVAATSQHAHVIFENLPPGTYGVKIYQDLNSNGGMDQKGIGIPTEPYGFSNGFEPRFGPPSFNSMSFVVASNESARQDIKLIQPPGGGNWGIGAAVMAKSEPYRGTSKRIIPMPNITYIGERLQFFGPIINYTVIDGRNADLAMTGLYRFAGYEADDDEIFTGMPDRDDTFEAGLRVALRGDGPTRLDIFYGRDVLDVHKGHRGGLGLRRVMDFKHLTFIPEVSAEWLSNNIVNYYYGVDAVYATEERPAYNADSAISPEIGATIIYPCSSRWTLTGRVSCWWLSDEIRESPLVDDDVGINTFLSITYSL